MINDIALSRDRMVVCYADDTSLLDVGRSLDDVSTLMRASMEMAADWFSANRFLLNAEKTQTIVFSLKNGKQHDCPPVKLLGFMLDRRLSWEEHIQGVCCRLSRILFLLKGLKRSAVNAFGDLEVQPVRGDSHEYGTRNRLRLDLPYCRLGRTQSSLVYLPGKMINKLPISVRSLPVAALKRRLKHFLQENHFYSLNEFFECDSALVSGYF
ncbi:uncharacterized protein LOC120354283 [Nilaparvata lugens]|uniref:uncharacterized protein LOC120354283 n=1 Tax=Nilaparvata lugens TaxID=108931 RepID=UPI00193D56F4|nr:uncharacterized protein LOC120354283 [Nilaparvata lugens]